MSILMELAYLKQLLQVESDPKVCNELFYFKYKA